MSTTYFHTHLFLLCWISKHLNNNDILAYRSTQCCLAKLYVLQKNQTAYCNRKRHFFKWNKFNLNYKINYLMQVIYHLCSKNAILTKEIYPVPVKLHKNCNKNNTFRALVEVKSFIISSKWAFAVYSLFILIKARSHNLPWLIAI